MCIKQEGVQLEAIKVEEQLQHVPMHSAVDLDALPGTPATAVPSSSLTCVQRQQGNISGNGAGQCLHDEKELQQQVAQSLLQLSKGGLSNPAIAPLRG